MILSQPEIIEKYVSQGLWGQVTLDDLLHSMAEKCPERHAVIDPHDRSDWSCGEAEALTYGELEKRIKAIANLLTSADLPMDSIIAYQMAPTVDAVVLFHGILRAGMIASPLPAYWRDKDIVDALRMVGPKALIGGARQDDDRPAERLRDVAAELFSVRFVGAFGDDIPDGVVDMSTALRAVDDVPYTRIERQGNTGSHVASITWASDVSGAPVAVPRSHNHWIATGLSTALEADLKKQSTMLCPFSLTNVVGIGSAMTATLLSEGTLCLHRFADLDELLRRTADLTPDALVIPENLHGPVLRRFTAGSAARPCILAVRNTTHPTVDNEIADGKCVLIYAINELAALPVSSDQGTGLPIGPIPYPLRSDNGRTLVESRLKGQRQSAGAQTVLGGELMLRGPAVPDAAVPIASGDPALVFDNDGYVRTSIGCRISASKPPRAEIIGQLGDVLTIGAAVVRVDELDALYRSHDAVADAAAFTVEDAVMGIRVCAAVVLVPGRELTLADLRSHLTEQRVSAHKLPVDIAIVDAIPKGNSGAVLRPNLADELVAA